MNSASTVKRCWKVCILVVAFSSGISACAGIHGYDRIADYPAPSQKLTVAVTGQVLDPRIDVSSGSYYDKERQVVVSGYQKGILSSQVGGFLVLGPIGPLIALGIADEANKSRGQKFLGPKPYRESLDIPALTQGILVRALENGEAPLWTLSADSPSLEIHPYAVFTLLKSGKARLYAELRVEKTGGDSVPWSVRYFARAPGEFALEGDDGWMTPSHFGEGIKSALHSALEACIADTSGKLSGARTAKVKGIMPYDPEERDYQIILAGEDSQKLIARVVLQNGWPASGIHVLNREDYVLTDSQFSDPRK